MTARPSVYALAREADRLFASADTMDAEEFDRALGLFLGDADDKLYRIDALRRRADTDAEYYKSEAARLSGQRKRAEALSERMAGLAVEVLKSRETVGEDTKIPGLVSLVRKEGRVVDILDKKAIPVCYFPMVRSSDPSKADILTALDEGETVPGVRVRECSEYPLWARTPKD